MITYIGFTYKKTGFFNMKYDIYRGNYAYYAKNRE